MRAQHGLARMTRTKNNLLGSEPREFCKVGSRLGHAVAGYQAGVDRGVLNVSVSEPILDKAEVGAGVEQMGGDGVLEDVEVLFVRRDV